MTIKISDIIQHGATVGCQGCKSAIKQSKNRLPHATRCRTRFENLLSGEGRAKKAKKRSDEFITKVIEADGIKRNPKKAKVDEEPAASIPVEPESDEDSEGEGPIQPSDGGEDPGTGRRVRRKTVNLLEGGSSIREEANREVNDDEEERRWAPILVHAVEGEEM